MKASKSSSTICGSVNPLARIPGMTPTESIFQPRCSKALTKSFDLPECPPSRELSEIPKGMSQQIPALSDGNTYPYGF